MKPSQQWLLCLDPRMTGTELISCPHWACACGQTAELELLSALRRGSDVGVRRLRRLIVRRFFYLDGGPGRITAVKFRPTQHSLNLSARARHLLEANWADYPCIELRRRRHAGIWSYARGIVLSTLLLTAGAAVIPRSAETKLGSGWKCDHSFFVTSCSQVTGG